MKNQVQLITYVDRFGGGTIAGLRDLLARHFQGCFGAVHLLPFFDPIDGADAGFDPAEHTKVDPRLGDWGDIERLAGDVDLMADVIVNHISTESPQFQHFSEHGQASPWAPMFLTFDRVFPRGATEADLLAIYRPRPGLPFTHATLRTGENRLLWTTFTPKQVDIDVLHPVGATYLDRILSTFAARGIRHLRLDAVGYAIKQPGTTCFMLPETFAFIRDCAGRAKGLGMDVLVEVHSYYRRQIEIAREVDWVYDFALPPLVLHAFAFGTATRLKHWLDIRPTNAVTVLDTHDGIGIVDIGSDADDRAARPGLVPDAELDQLVEWIHANSDGASREATGRAASNVDLYQVNCTFFDALGGDERSYLAARALQFFVPGVPQVYYVGLLAGSNDRELLRRSGVGRDINRHHYSVKDIEAELDRPVVQALRELILLRSHHPAFQGHCSVSGGEGSVLRVRWEQGTQREHWADLQVDFQQRRVALSASDTPGRPFALPHFTRLCNATAVEALK